MWRSNVSWNSTDSSLPEGMHKHETGAYFKTGGQVVESMRRSNSPTSALEEEPEEPSKEPAPSPRQQASTGRRRAGRLREAQRHSSNSSASTSAGGAPPPASGRSGGTGSGTTGNFRARLSSISGALGHPPRLAKRLFAAANQAPEESPAHRPAPVQITTTTIDSPQHPNQNPEEPGASPRPMLASGRRLSQLFLPQLAQHPTGDPFQQAPDLFPAHLLGLYGQPPLVGGAGVPGGLGGPRASWADISLLGRLPNMRPSIDSAFLGLGAGQMRHSFDARSEQCNEPELGEDRPSCMQIMKKLFFSLVLGTLVAICWVLIIHTLKWIAIRGNEFELKPNILPAGTGPSALQSSAMVLVQPPPAARVQRATPTHLARPDPPNHPLNERHQIPIGLRMEAVHATSGRAARHQDMSDDQEDERPQVLASRPPAPPPLAPSDSDEADEGVLGGWPDRSAQPQAGQVGRSGMELAGNRPASGQLQPPGLMYKAPFFTSWFVSIWNILFMPIFTLISSCCFRNEDSTTKKLLVRESISQFMDNGLTTLQFLGRCAFFSLLWIGTIFGIVYSLANIDATVVMALFACSVALVYLLSWVLLHQQFVGVRIVAVIICTTGIALLAYMDNSRTLGSVLIVAGSALCSAVYKVIYQRMFGFWSIAQMSLFFTLIGLFNAFLMWPVALLLYFLGVELIVWRYIPWIHLTAAGGLHLIANIVAYFGPICSYDIFLTMGLLLAVVLSAVIDVSFYKIAFSGMKLAGVLLLMVGFLVCLLPENWNEFLYDLVNERFVRWKKQRSLKKSRNKVQDLSTGQMSRLRTPSGRVK